MATNPSGHADGGTIDEPEGQDDQALLNMISETARKSKYNNSKRGTKADGHKANEGSDAEAAAEKFSKRPSFFCACGGPPSAVATKDRDENLIRDGTSKVSYSILHLVGEGGFSKVLLVRAKSGHLSERNEGVYAAKIIPKSHLKSAGESFVKATMLERNILGKFNHPFLLKLYHSFQERDRLILVVDYCPGGSLHTHVNISLREAGGGFSESRSAFYVAEIALACAHLHLHGIVHRDLKLENVLMHASGHCAVSDFGASKRLKPPAAGDCRARGQPSSVEELRESHSDRSSFASGATPPDALAAQTRSIVGTPAYMAPEMLLAQPYDFAVDWWALGVLLFTMLKGRLPFDAAEEDKMLWRIVKSKPRYDAAWSQPMLDVLRALLQKRPKTRLCSLKALAEQPLFCRMEWQKLERLQLAPPYVPSLSKDDDRRYVPRRIAETAVPSMALEYKKGDSMKKLFRKFSHRSSFEGNDPNGTPASPPKAKAPKADAQQR
ncbi:kinase-like domain-containing protein [Pelagophyceae sp. CCMP2097]|nr:kinase-like domain-containing protein [Pelagophyceae sp. CCMP2097]|mmetsp:Transcript_16456/g.55550  ORF Transcript_16456/g.55550 Transcript_16456/m.55550 type:complete len:495 (-) Transcript_16456:6-1490(-)